MTKKFVVEYTNKDIMDKLESVHALVKVTNGSVKLHQKLILGAYIFTFLSIIVAIILG